MWKMLDLEMKIIIVVLIMSCIIILWAQFDRYVEHKHVHELIEQHLNSEKRSTS